MTLAAMLKSGALLPGSWVQTGTIALTSPRGITTEVVGGNVDIFVTQGSATTSPTLNGISNIVEFVDLLVRLRRHLLWQREYAGAAASQVSSSAVSLLSSFPSRPLSHWWLRECWACSRFAAVVRKVRELDSIHDGSLRQRSGPFLLNPK